ncbi:TetR/AcrR family transcriptional regulator [Pleomorphomonas sp. PLEO]|uniref:TetR/AcrR family transcriptional regulator n=1 Tax=Pleomorphomonas sp. PLEO TaxID=3239306 RepID=UPI00351F47E9
MERKRSDHEAIKKKPSGAAVMQEEVTRALTRAFFEEWARSGYGALSLEAVAARAGVGKAALYRRWPSKLALATERLEAVGIPATAYVDAGSFEADTLTLLRSLRRLLRHPLVRRILPDLHAEMLRNVELAHAVRGRLQTERRRRAADIFNRAKERGEVDQDADPELFSDLVGSMIYWRVIVTNARVDQAYLRMLTALVVKAFRKT